MTLALATLAFLIAALFSGLVLGALRDAIAVSSRPARISREPDTGAVIPSSNL